MSEDSTIDFIHNSPRHQKVLRYPLRRVVSAMLFQGDHQKFGNGHYEYILECGHPATSRGCRRATRMRCKMCWQKEQRSKRDKARYAAKKAKANL